MAGVKPALVLLPGMDGTGTLFDPLAAALGDAVELIRVCYPPDQALAYGELEQLARRALPTGRPYVLLGESFSGPIAIALAAQRPPGLVGLVLCCTFASNPRPALRGLAWLARGAWLKPAARWMAAPLLLGRSGNASLRRWLAQALAPVTAAVLAQRARAVLAVDVTAQLSLVAVPIHYLQATRDRLVPLACAEAITRRNARVITHRIDGPHCLLQAAPGPCASVLRQLLSVG
ncbi:alpha/beta hydrolase [Massilia sp. SR12]